LFWLLMALALAVMVGCAIGLCRPKRSEPEEAD
jgi:hypothetical protein